MSNIFEKIETLLNELAAGKSKTIIEVPVKNGMLSFKEDTVQISKNHMEVWAASKGMPTTDKEDRYYIEWSMKF